METCEFCNQPVSKSDHPCATAEGGLAHQECVRNKDVFCGDCSSPSLHLHENGLCESCYKEALCPNCGGFRRELGWEPCEHCDHKSVG